MIFAQTGEDLAKNTNRRQKESPAASSSASTNPTMDQTTPIQPNPLVFAVGGGFSRQKPDVIESVVGWAQTLLGPTRGHL